MKKIFIVLISTIILLFIALESAIYFTSIDNFNQDAKYFIVLGAKVRKKTPSLSLKYRMDACLKYLKKYPNMILIATGGQGEDEEIPEAIAIRNYMISHGISDKRIIVEDKSKNTFENFKYARKLIKEKGNIKVNISSNRYHIMRAKLLAKRNGFIPYTVPAKTPKKVILQSYIRESLAYIKSYIFDR